ncbi:Glucooligosaccharide oxidase [Zasmidium cellare ATCC 36951]|uniref:Glucooligosaccharide oxidase n=1 Tax=Zasmidium cellare ATCC 36951 TaxID=1080233 RepID=A0A6A6CIT2_ZASCE|nr:Glucooligosaccharide oxidase [Zasmidium cellare ATCC 36951]KAF2165872.1 Glucooligosaccharide oxidase [Zasmidium cellare ATCC 36951]
MGLFRLLLHLFVLCSLTTASLDLPQSLVDCLAKTSADIVHPSSSDYNTTAQSQNTNYHYRPAAIALPKSTNEVAAVIKCASAQPGVKVSTYGGGHGYASYALGGSDGYLVIDSQRIQDITINEAEKTATVGMGVRLGLLSKAIGAKGFAIPHGTCSSVGIVGHALGGGWGYSSRKWGWTMDHIVEIEYVDPTGAVKKVGDGVGDQAIWWAMRGAGANNFGVVTSLTFQGVATPATSLNWKTVLHKNEECAVALLTIQELGARRGALPAELGVQLLLYGEGTESNPGACQLSGQYFGDEEEFRRLEVVIREGLERTGVEGYRKANVSEFGSWVETLTDLLGNLTAPPNAVPYYAQSIIDYGSPNYTNSTIQPILQAIQATVNISKTSTSLSFDLNGPAALTNIDQPHGASAFADAGKRKALFLSQIYNYGTPTFEEPEKQEEIFRLVDGVQRAVRAAKPDGRWGSYVNYVDPRLKDWGREYYGDALGRLKEIKKSSDPENIFDFPQGLGRA